MPAAAVTAIHHRIETLACPQAEPNNKCTSGGGLTEIFVVFVSNRVNPAAPPETQKLGGEDRMNDGRPVRTVMIPLISPTHAPAKRTMAIISQNGTLNTVVPIARKTAEAPTMDPTERSNSPAIIRTPTGMAMMPSSAAVSSQPAVPSIDTKPAPCVGIAKKR